MRTKSCVSCERTLFEDDDALCVDCRREEHLFYETSGNCFSCDEPIADDNSCVCYPNEEAA